MADERVPELEVDGCDDCPLAVDRHCVAESPPWRIPDGVDWPMWCRLQTRDVLVRVRLDRG